MPADSRRRSRSPRRSASPPPSRNRDSRSDRYDDRRDSNSIPRGGQRGGDHGRDDYRGGGGGRGGYDRDSGGGGGGGGGRGDRRRSRSPLRGAPPPHVPSGDGGWGRQRSASPGRPSKALADQRDLVPGGGARDVGEGGEKKEIKHVEPDFKPSGALAAETKCVFLFLSLPLSSTADCGNRAAPSTASSSSMPSRQRRGSR